MQEHSIVVIYEYIYSMQIVILDANHLVFTLKQNFPHNSNVIEPVLTLLICQKRGQLCLSFEANQGQVVSSICRVKV